MPGLGRGGRSSPAFRGSSRWHAGMSGCACPSTQGARPDTLIHLNVKDDAVSEEFGIPVDEEGLAGRECDLTDSDGNRLRIATRPRQTRRAAAMPLSQQEP